MNKSKMISLDFVQINRSLVLCQIYSLPQCKQSALNEFQLETCVYLP